MRGLTLGQSIASSHVAPHNPLELIEARLVCHWVCGGTRENTLIGKLCLFLFLTLSSNSERPLRTPSSQLIDSTPMFSSPAHNSKQNNLIS